MFAGLLETVLSPDDEPLAGEGLDVVGGFGDSESSDDDDDDDDSDVDDEATNEGRSGGEKRCLLTGDTIYLTSRVAVPVAERGGAEEEGADVQTIAGNNTRHYLHCKGFADKRIGCLAVKLPSKRERRKSLASAAAPQSAPTPAPAPMMAPTAATSRGTSGAGGDVNDTLIGFAGCLFRVCKQLHYDAQKMYDRLARQSCVGGGVDYSFEDGDIEHEVAVLKEKARKEHEQNVFAMNVVRGSHELHYGDIVQFQHVRSGEFLTMIPRALADKEKSCIKCILDKGNPGSWFRLMPQFKTKRHGELVYFGDKIKIQNVKANDRFVHASSLNFDVDRFNRAEANLSGRASAWHLHFYAGLSEDEGTFLRLGTAIRFFHRDGEGFLAASANEYRSRSAYIRRLVGDSDPMDRINSTAKSLWKLECAHNRTLGGFARWDQKFRLQHVPSRKYLSVRAQYSPWTRGQGTSAGETPLGGRGAAREGAGRHASRKQLMSVLTDDVDDRNTVFVLHPITPPDEDESRIPLQGLCVQLECVGNGCWLTNTNEVKFKEPGRLESEALKATISGTASARKRNFVLAFQSARHLQDVLAIIPVVEDDDRDAEHARTIYRSLSCFEGIVDRRRSGGVAANGSPPPLTKEDLAVIEHALISLADFVGGAPGPGDTRKTLRRRADRQQLLRELKVVDAIGWALLAPFRLKHCSIASLLESRHAPLRSTYQMLFQALALCFQGNIQNAVYCYLHSPAMWQPERTPPLPDEKYTARMVEMLGHKLGAANCVREMLTSDRNLLEVCVNDEMITKFTHLLKTKGPEERFLQFLAAICRFKNGGIPVNQEKLHRLVYSGGDDVELASHRLELLMETALLPPVEGGVDTAPASPRRRTRFRSRSRAWPKVANLPDQNYPEYLGKELLSGEWCDLAVSWLHPADPEVDVAPNSVYFFEHPMCCGLKPVNVADGHPESARHFVRDYAPWAADCIRAHHHASATRGSDSGGTFGVFASSSQENGDIDTEGAAVDRLCADAVERTWVRLEDIAWTLDPQVLYCRIYGALWVEPASDDPAREVFRKKRQLAQYYLASLRLMASMCIDRNYTSIENVERQFTYEVVISGIINDRLPAIIRAAFAELMYSVYINRFPHERMPLPSLVRNYREVHDISLDDPEALPRFKLDPASLPARSPNPFIRHPDHHKFHLFTSLVKAYLDGLGGAMAIASDNENKLTLVLLRCVRELAACGFYSDTATLTDLIRPVVDLVDSRNDTIEGGLTRTRGISRLVSMVSSRDMLASRLENHHDTSRLSLAGAPSSSVATSDAGAERYTGSNEDMLSGKKELMDIVSSFMDIRLDYRLTRFLSAFRSAQQAIGDDGMLFGTTKEPPKKAGGNGGGDEDGDTGPRRRTITDQLIKPLAKGKRMRKRSSFAGFNNVARSDSAGEDPVLAKGGAHADLQLTKLGLRAYADCFQDDDVRRLNIDEASDTPLVTACLDLLMYEDDGVFEKAITTLVRHFSQHEMFARMLSNLQLVGNSEDETAAVLFTELHTGLSMLRRDVDSFNGWQHHALGEGEEDAAALAIREETARRVCDFLGHLAAMCVESPPNADPNGDDDYFRPNSEIQDLLRNMGCHGAVLRIQQLALPREGAHNRARIFALKRTASNFFSKFVKDNRENQKELFGSLDLFLRQMGHGLGVAPVLSNIFHNNKDLCEKLPEQVLLRFAETIEKKGPRPRWIKFMASTIVPENVAVQKNQKMVLDVLCDRSFSHVCLTLCETATCERAAVALAQRKSIERGGGATGANASLNQETELTDIIGLDQGEGWKERRRLMALQEQIDNGKLSRSELTSSQYEDALKLEYHCELIRLLATVSIGKSDYCEVKCAQIVSLATTLAVILDTRTTSNVLLAFTQFLTEVYFDTSIAEYANIWQSPRVCEVILRLLDMIVMYTDQRRLLADDWNVMANAAVGDEEKKEGTEEILAATRARMHDSAMFDYIFAGALPAIKAFFSEVVNLRKPHSTDIDGLAASAKEAVEFLCDVCKADIEGLGPLSEPKRRVVRSVLNIFDENAHILRPPATPASPGSHGGTNGFGADMSILDLGVLQRDPRGSNLSRDVSAGIEQLGTTIAGGAREGLNKSKEGVEMVGKGLNIGRKLTTDTAAFVGKSSLEVAKGALSFGGDVAKGLQLDKVAKGLQLDKAAMLVIGRAQKSLDVVLGAGFGDPRDKSSGCFVEYGNAGSLVLTDPSAGGFVGDVLSGEDDDVPTLHPVHSVSGKAAFKCLVAAVTNSSRIQAVSQIEYSALVWNFLHVYDLTDQFNEAHQARYRSGDKAALADIRANSVTFQDLCAKCVVYVRAHILDGDNTVMKHVLRILRECLTAGTWDPFTSEEARKAAEFSNYGEDAARTYMQQELDNCGVSKMCIDILSLITHQDIVVEAMQLMVLLLRNGHSQVQSTIYDYFVEKKITGFFENMKDRISSAVDLQKSKRRARKAAERLAKLKRSVEKNDAAGGGNDEGGESTTTAGRGDDAKKEDTSSVGGQQTEGAEKKVEVATVPEVHDPIRVHLLFSMLQQMTEGHNASLQNILRDQSHLHFPQSHSLLAETVVLFETAAKNEAAIRRMGVDVVRDLAYLLNFIIEVCQGPCVENQEVLAQSNTVDTCMRLISTNFPAQIPRRMTKEVKANAVKALTCLIEGRPDHVVHRILLSKCDAAVFKHRLSDIHKQFEVLMEDDAAENANRSLIGDWDEEFLDEGMDLLTLCLSLADCDDCEKNSPFRKDFVPMIASDVFAAPTEVQEWQTTLKFYRSKLRSLEIVQRGHLSKIFFAKTSESELLGDIMKNQIKQTIRYESDDKMQEFCNKAPDVSKELLHREWLDAFHFYQIIGRNLYTIKRCGFFLALLMNTTMILSLNIMVPSDDSHAGEEPGVAHSEPHAPSPQFDPPYMRSVIDLAGLLQLVSAIVVLAFILVQRAPLAAFRSHKSTLERTIAHATMPEKVHVKTLFECFTAFIMAVLVICSFSLVVLLRLGFTEEILLTRSPMPLLFFFGPYYFLKGVRVWFNNPGEKRANNFVVVYDALTEDGTTLYYCIYLMTAVLAYSSKQYYMYMFHLMDIVLFSPQLQNVVKAVVVPAASLGLTAMLAIIIIYGFALFAFFFFADSFWDPERGERVCDSMARCFMVFLHDGLLAGGGIGEYISWELGNGPDPSNEGKFASRTAFDIFFFVIVLVLLLNIIFGIIIDTFGQLRDTTKQRLDLMTTKCFVCTVDKNVFDQPQCASNFRDHIEKDHNMWDYLLFLVYLIRKDPNEYTGPETFVADLVKQKNMSWVPFHRAMCLDEEDDDHKTIETEMLRQSMRIDHLQDDVKACLKQLKLVNENLCATAAATQAAAAASNGSSNALRKRSSSGSTLTRSSSAV